MLISASLPFLPLAALLLRLGIALEDGDTQTARATLCEIESRFGVRVQLPSYLRVLRGYAT